MSMDDDGIQVMVRAYGNEPVIVFATANLGDAIEIYRASKSKRVGWSVHQIFEFDEPLFNEIKAAHAENNMPLCDRLWDYKARRFRFPK